MQELRRPVEKEEHKNLRALEEELIANIKKSQFLVAMERSEEEPKKDQYSISEEQGRTDFAAGIFGYHGI